MANLTPPKPPNRPQEPAPAPEKQPDPAESVVVKSVEEKPSVDPVTEKVLSVLGVVYPGKQEAQQAIGVDGIDFLSYKVNKDKMKSLRLVALGGSYVWVLWPTH
jgi:hypothetical protein